MVYTSSPTSISHLKAATPIRLIEGGVISPNNSGLGSPRNGRESSLELGVPRHSLGSSVGSGTCYLAGPGLLMMSGSSIVLESGVTNQLGTRRRHRDVLVVNLLNEGRLQAIQSNG